LEDLGRDGRIVKIDLRNVILGGLNWNDLNQDRKEWRALVNDVMNIGVPQRAGDFLTNSRPNIISGRTVLQGVGYLVIIYYYCLRLCSPARAMVSSTRFLDHTPLRATVGRTPQDEPLLTETSI
jgi:hypothetical protein